MPYIIDTKSPRATARTADGRAVELYEGRAASGRHDYDVVSSRAEATISEARAAVLADLGDRGAIDGPEHELCGHVLDLTESGGTIGPLPDGYVIDVRLVSPLRLASLAGMSGADVMACKIVEEWDFAPIIDAYNDR